MTSTPHVLEDFGMSPPKFNDTPVFGTDALSFSPLVPKTSTSVNSSPEMSPLLSTYNRSAAASQTITLPRLNRPILTTKAKEVKAEDVALISGATVVNASPEGSKVPSERYHTRETVPIVAHKDHGLLQGEGISPVFHHIYPPSQVLSMDISSSKDMIDAEMELIRRNTCNSEISQFIESQVYLLHDMTPAQQIPTDVNSSEIVSCVFSQTVNINDVLHRIVKQLVLLHAKPEDSGKVFRGSVMAESTSVVDPFVIKFDEHQELCHEAAVGLLCINNLKRIVPNFMYTYHYRHCNPPKMNGKEVVSWCTSDTPRSDYLVVENVRNGVTLREFSKTCTPEAYLNVYLQVVNALLVANHHYGFTHYDLHDQNVMVKRLPTSVKIRLHNGDYLVTNTIAYIIDYGLARVNFHGIMLGVSYLGRLGITRRSDFPAYDTYKLLAFTVNSLRKDNEDTPHNMPLYSVCDQLFQVYGECPINRRIVQYVTSNDIDNAEGIPGGNRTDFLNPRESLRSLRYFDIYQWTVDTAVKVLGRSLVIPASEEYTLDHIPDAISDNTKDYSRDNFFLTYFGNSADTVPNSIAEYRMVLKATPGSSNDIENIQRVYDRDYQKLLEADDILNDQIHKLYDRISEVKKSRTGKISTTSTIYLSIMERIEALYSDRRSWIKWINDCEAVERSVPGLHFDTLESVRSLSTRMKRSIDEVWEKLDGVSYIR